MKKFFLFLLIFSSSNLLIGTHPPVQGISPYVSFDIENLETNNPQRNIIRVPEIVPQIQQEVSSSEKCKDRCIKCLLITSLSIAFSIITVVVLESFNVI